MKKKVVDATTFFFITKGISQLLRRNGTSLLNKTSLLNAALSYGSESWLDTSLKDVKKLHICAIKNVLAVTVTTPLDFCLIKLGYPHIHALVGRRQQQFFSKMMSDRQYMTDGPLMFAIGLTQTHNETMMQCTNGTLIYANLVTGAQAELNNKVKCHLQLGPWQSLGHIVLSIMTSVWIMPTLHISQNICA